MGIVVNACVAGRNSAAVFYGGSFGDDQARSAYCPAAEMYEVPGLGMAVFGGVLAHGRNDDAVFQFDFADSQRSE